MDKKYVIITGSNGYLGKYLCLEAVKLGINVIALRFDHNRSTVVKHKNIQYVRCDITKDVTQNRSVAEAIKGKDITGIVNAAALLGSPDYNDNFAVNATGVQNMIDFAKANSIKRFIQISSVVILKAIKGPYGETKLAGQEFAEKSGLDYTIFIPALVLGPESLGINRILKNVFRFPMVVPLIGTGKQTQHPIFVKDFAHYILKSVEAEACHRKVYQVASESVISFKNLIKLILKVKGKSKIFIPIPVFVASLMGKFFQAVQKVPVFTAEHVKGIMQDSKLDTSQLQADLNFKPTPMEEALEFTLGEIQENWSAYLTSREEEFIEA